MKRVFVGIDIQERRGCCFAILQDDGVVEKSGWFGEDPVAEVVSLVNNLKDKYNVSVGIDGPRYPLPSPRKWYWNRRAATLSGNFTRKGATAPIRRSRSILPVCRRTDTN